MIIDADAHIEESEAMFERLDKEFQPRRGCRCEMFATSLMAGTMPCGSSTARPIRSWSARAGRFYARRR